MLTDSLRRDLCVCVSVCMCACRCVHVYAYVYMCRHIPVHFSPGIGHCVLPPLALALGGQPGRVGQQSLLEPQLHGRQTATEQELSPGKCSGKAGGLGREGCGVQSHRVWLWKQCTDLRAAGIQGTRPGHVRLFTSAPLGTGFGLEG